MTTLVVFAAMFIPMAMMPIKLPSQVASLQVELKVANLLEESQVTTKMMIVITIHISKNVIQTIL